MSSLLDTSPRHAWKTHEVHHPWWGGAHLHEAVSELPWCPPWGPMLIRPTRHEGGVKISQRPVSSANLWHKTSLSFEFQPSKRPGRSRNFHVKKIMLFSMNDDWCQHSVDLSALLELQTSLLNYSVQTLSPRHHRLAATESSNSIFALYFNRTEPGNPDSLHGQLSTFPLSLRVEIQNLS